MYSLFKILLLLGLMISTLQYPVDSSNVFTNSWTPENCRRELLAWCRSLKKSPPSNINVMTTVHTNSGPTSIYCTENENESICYMSGKPWFQCNIQTSELNYNGHSLDNQETNLDNICEARDVAKNYLSFNETAFRIDMDRFDKNLNENMRDMTTNLNKNMEDMTKNLNKNIENMTKQLSNIPNQVMKQISESLGGQFTM